MQRSAGTSRMVPDPQTAKVGNGKSVLKSNITAVPPFGNPMEACEGYRQCIELPCHCEERSDVAIRFPSEIYQKSMSLRGRLAARGNLPVRAYPLLCTSMDGTRRLPRLLTQARNDI